MESQGDPLVRLQHNPDRRTQRSAKVDPLYSWKKSPVHASSLGQDKGPGENYSPARGLLRKRAHLLGLMTLRTSNAQRAELKIQNPRTVTRPAPPPCVLHSEDKGKDKATYSADEGGCNSLGRAVVLRPEKKQARLISHRRTDISRRPRSCQSASLEEPEQF